MELIPSATGPLGRFSKGRVGDNRIALNFGLATHIVVCTKCLNIVAVVKVPPQRAGFPSYPGNLLAYLYGNCGLEFASLPQYCFVKLAVSVS